jgi:hypothetical protein
LNVSRRRPGPRLDPGLRRGTGWQDWRGHAKSTSQGSPNRKRSVITHVSLARIMQSTSDCFRSARAR